MNKAGVASEAVAICKLGSSNMIITIKDEQACTSWLACTKWLAAFREGVRVKRREFAIIAYRIRVNQI